MEGVKLLLKPQEVCERTGLGRSTVYQMIRRYELPAIRVGRAVRVPVRQLEQWIEERQPKVGDGANPGR